MYSEKALSLLFIFVLLFTQFSTVFAYSSLPQDSENISSISLQEEDIPQEGAYSCNLSQLSEEEAQALLDLRKEGTIFSELGSDSVEDTDRETLKQDTAIIPDSEGELGLKQSFPNQAFDASEASFLLNRQWSGAFAFGLILTDTLRIGRCIGDVPCYTEYPNTQLKNDGAGFFKDVKNVWNDVKNLNDAKQISQEDFDLLSASVLQGSQAEETPEETSAGGTSTETETPAESSEEVASIEPEDVLNSENAYLEGSTVSRIPGDALRNVIGTDNFEARMQTNSNNSSSVISLYSLFDKYFNTWFSLDLVVGNAAPTLLGKARRAFGWTADRLKWPWEEGFKGFKYKFRNAFEKPSSIIGQTRLKVFENNLQKYPETFKPFYSNLFGGSSPILSHNSGEKYIADAFAEGGILRKLPKTYEARKAFVQSSRNALSYAKASNALSRQAASEFAAAEAAFKAGTLNAVGFRAAKTEYGQKIAKLAADYDSGLSLHVTFPNTIAFDERFGFLGVGVKSEGGQIVPFGHKNTPNKIIDSFADSGTFRGSTFETANDSLVIYRIRDDAKFIAEVTASDFEASVRAGRYLGNTVELENGRKMVVNQDNLNYILGHLDNTGNVRMFDQDWARVEELSPDEFADRILAENWVASRFGVVEANLEKLELKLQQENFASRRYYSLIDKMLLEENNLVKNYFTPGLGAAKWTALPYAYWWFKKGVVSQDFSAYRLPTSWKELIFFNGEESIYNDAFIDFFANTGSDQGDLFVKLLNVLPWKLVIDQATKVSPPVKNIEDILTGQSGRDKVEDIALFSYGPKKCSNCSINVRSEGTDFSPEYQSGESITDFVFEHTQENKDVTIISYAHHTNIEGDSKEEGNPETIDLAEAKRNGNTCADAVNDIAVFGFITPEERPELVGLSLAVAENAAYFAFGLPGVFASVLQQVNIASKLNDCVDDKEGYYAHYYAAAPDQQEETASSSEDAALKTANLVEAGQKTVDNLLSGLASQAGTEQEQEIGGKGVVGNLMDRVKDGTAKLASNLQDKDIVQATIQQYGKSNGNLNGRKIFWFWTEGGSSGLPSKYLTEGKIALKSEDGETSLDIDFASGKISKNGETIVSNKDITRLSTPDLAVPGVIVPQRITALGLPGTKTLMIEVSASGEAVVKDSAVLDCFKSAVKAQSGVELSGDNLAEAFGSVTSVVTDVDTVLPQEDRITATGELRYTADGKDSRIDIYGNREVELIDVKDSETLTASVGNLESIQFKNGVAVYKEETNELIIWLRHNEQAVLSNKDVSGLKASSTTVQNPVTKCEEPAINLQVIANPESDLSATKADAMNSGLEINGPFQVFDTDKRLFVFYASDPPECEPRFKIIDKETGEVYDQAITSLENTPSGVIVKTDDGRNHTLDFSAPGGVPTLTYNGDAQTLRQAQGPNGSFYYDPDKGLWYAENGQIIPLLEAFKQQGLSTQVQDDGRVAGLPGTNIFIGSQEGDGLGLLNLPSLPENPLLILLFVLAIISAFVVIRRSY